MIYSNIKKSIAIALLVVFRAPCTLALSAYESVPAVDSVVLSGNVRLTDKNNTITLSLRDSDVKQVLRMFADKAGMNIVFHNSVSGKITLDLVQTPINEAFNMVLQIAGLNYYKNGNTMIIMASDDAANAAFSQQEMMIFPVKYVNAAKIADFLNKNVFGLRKTGLSSVEAVTVNTATNELIVFGMPNDVSIVEKVIAQFDKEPVTQTYTVNHTTPAEMAKLVCDMLQPGTSKFDSSASGQADGSGAGITTGGAASAEGSGEGEEGAGAGSGSSTIKLGEGIVACTISSETENKTLAPFVAQNLSVTYFPQRGVITLLGGSAAQAHMVEKFIKDNDIKQPQAYLEVSVVELNEDGAKDFQNIWSITSKNWFANFDGKSTSAGRVGKAYAPTTQYLWDGGNKFNDVKGEWDGQPYVTQDGTFNVPQQIARTFYDTVGSVHINWTMNYLIENRKGRVLANPKILITNGQESIIDLTQDYVKKVTSQYLTSALTAGGATGTAQKQYDIGEDLGVKVTLTPFISPEGYVTMNIQPKFSTIYERVTTASEVQGVNDTVATLLSRRNLDLKNVRIKDGETLVIGGMIQESEQKTVHKIPVLGDLPVIGAAFRSSSTTKAKSELIIMITPKIINEDAGAVASDV
ncbi:MAG: secretin and TonB N-terminal domain-containing protein [bacterium]|nr:secretin and TonB N-terminal domain-containing protein [bacterium]